MLSSGAGKSGELSAKALGSNSANRAILSPTDNRCIKSISLSELAYGDLSQFQRIWDFSQNMKRNNILQKMWKKSRR
ncbi:hypothetical protein AFERRI_250003 [Acidithiobacillus ferrivorans]|uniref:Uncharacterized protein n=1 Tax=Acidithiobacillus ferrivorans TaxID=160808 RepID=A0A060ULE5_9PROT|nr:hypothetical protein AFERRI_250003 [Acidithiobacillus ferrivorans]